MSCDGDGTAPASARLRDVDTGIAKRNLRALREAYGLGGDIRDLTEPLLLQATGWVSAYDRKRLVTYATRLLEEALRLQDTGRPG